MMQAAVNTVDVDTHPVWSGSDAEEKTLTFPFFALLRKRNTYTYTSTQVRIPSPTSSLYPPFPYNGRRRSHHAGRGPTHPPLVQPLDPLWPLCTLCTSVGHIPHSN